MSKKPFKVLVTREIPEAGLKLLRRNKNFERKYGAKRAKVDAIMKTADFISLHVPLLPSTHHLINRRRLNMMRQTAYLINTSRGPIVDEAGLVSALKKTASPAQRWTCSKTNPN